MQLRRAIVETSFPLALPLARIAIANPRQSDPRNAEHIPEWKADREIGRRCEEDVDEMEKERER